MRYRKVPNTDLEVSEISMGTGDYAGGMVYSGSREQVDLVARALELGVNLFDTSPDYGKGLGEANLGRALRELGAQEPHIITKVEIWPEHFGMIAERIEESVHDSLLRLQRTHVDVLMLHNPVRFTRDLSIRRWARMTPDDVCNEVLPAMQKVKKAGKTRYLGLACESSDTKAVEPLLSSGEFSMINAWYNLANPSAAVRTSGLTEQEDYDGLFASAQRHGAGVAVIRPLAGGALSRPMMLRGHEGRHPLSQGNFRKNPGAFKPILQRARRFDFLDRLGEQSISEAAVRFILRHPAVTSIIGGFSETAHLEEAAHCSDHPDLSSSDVDRIEAILNETPLKH